jgi:hypothetical protein
MEKRLLQRNQSEDDFASPRNQSISERVLGAFTTLADCILSLFSTPVHMHVTL